MDEPISKTAKKKQVEALQRLGVDLVELPNAQLDRIPLSPELKQAILDARKIKSNGAKRRQAQLIGKLMRQDDSEEIERVYQEIMDEGASQTAAFHDCERWRERLLSDDKLALSEFVDTYHPDDIQQLRQLIQKARDEQQKAVNRGSAKALFRMIRDAIQ